MTDDRMTTDTLAQIVKVLMAHEDGEWTGAEEFSCDCGESVALPLVDGVSVDVTNARRWYFEHVAAILSALPATNTEPGICGNRSPAIALSGTSPVTAAICQLRAGHAGWHHSDDGSDWTHGATNTEPVDEDAVAFIKRLINAWDCCGTCAGGVLAARDRAMRANTEPVDATLTDEARASALREAASECHTEARWQMEKMSRAVPPDVRAQHEYARDRLLVVEQILTDRAARLAATTEREQQAKAEAWDQGWHAAQEVVELEGQKVWAHTVFPEGYEGNPYRGDL